MPLIRSEMFYVMMFQEGVFINPAGPCSEHRLICCCCSSPTFFLGGGGGGGGGGGAIRLAPTTFVETGCYSICWPGSGILCLIGVKG